MKFPSKKTFDETTQFALLPADDYEVIISEIKEEIQNKYKAVPDENGVMPQEQILRCVFSVVSFKDGASVKDSDGNDAKNRKLFFTGRPESMGWKISGEPAKTRCLVAYATGQNINDELELNDWQDLVGKTLFVEVIQGQNQKGKKINKITRLILPRVDRTVTPNETDKTQDPHDRIDKFLDNEVAKDNEEINVEDIDMG